MKKIVEVKYDQRHGGAYDRGAADSYYGRRFDPHYYVGDTGTSKRVGLTEMILNFASDEIAAYTAGFNDNEANGARAWRHWPNGDKKDWG